MFPPATTTGTAANSGVSLRGVFRSVTIVPRRLAACPRPERGLVNLGEPAARVHVVGGIADRAGPTDLAGFVGATRHVGAIGWSVYDYATTASTAWTATTLTHRRARPSARPQRPIEASAGRSQQRRV